MGLFQASPRWSGVARRADHVWAAANGNDRKRSRDRHALSRVVGCFSRCTARDTRGAHFRARSRRALGGALQRSFVLVSHRRLRANRCHPHSVWTLYLTFIRIHSAVVLSHGEYPSAQKEPARMREASLEDDLYVIYPFAKNIVGISSWAIGWRRHRITARGQKPLFQSFAFWCCCLR
jgi:hypothetical protein